MALFPDSGMNSYSQAMERNIILIIEKKEVKCVFSLIVFFL
jgi:hypothetical protein